MKRIFIFCLLLFLYAGKLRAQNPLRFEHFSLEEGLSQNVVHCIFQDHNGFLWIGTHNGLNRYDGYAFKKYYNNPFDANSPGDNIIFAIDEDSSGTLWVLSAGYLHSFHPGKQRFERFPLPTPPPTALPGALPEMIVAGKNQLLVKSSGSIYLFDADKKKFTPVPFENTSANADIRFKRLLKTPPGEILIAAPGQEKGFFIFDREQHSFKRNLPRHLSYAEVDAVIVSATSDDRSNIIAVDESSQLHLLFANGIKKIKKLGPVLTLKSSPATLRFMPDSSGKTWIATGDGLLIYDIKNENLQVLHHDAELPFTLSSDVLRCMLLDRSGNLWIGTYGAGLNKCNTGRPSIINFSPGSNISRSLGGKFILGIRETVKENIFISFYESQEISVIDPERNKALLFSTSWLKNNQPAIADLYPDLIDQDLPDSFRFILTNPKIRSQSNPILFTDKKKNCWKRNDFSLYRLNDKREFLIGSFIEAISEDSAGNFWIGTNNSGLFYINTTTGAIRNYKNNPELNYSLSGNTVDAVVQDKDGKTLWLATDFGLNRFDIPSGKAEHFTTVDGLCHNTVYSLVPDNEGKLWLGTGNGLSRFDPVTRSFTNYNRKDGLVNSEYNRNAAIKTKKGELVFGGTEGIDLFQPRDLYKQTLPPAVSITSMQVSNKDFFIDDKATLSYKQNNISIEFAAMDFTNPAKNKYAYMLEGIDKTWTIIGERHAVSFASLSPGRYVLKVKAANAGGTWNDRPASLPFTILPPWWKTWWFFVLCAMIIAAALYALFRFRLQQHLEIYRLRQKLSRDLHDDVGATLSTVKAYTEMLKENPGKTEFIQLISNNADEMLEKLEVIAWANSPEHDTVQSLLEKMRLLGTPVFYHKNINLEFEAEPSLNKMLLPGNMRQNLFMIFKEAINNIIKYAQCSFCFVSLKKKGNNLLLQVTDNGVGFNDASSKGNGLNNMEARVKELGGDLSIRSAPGKGTTILAVIPLHLKFLEKTKP